MNLSRPTVVLFLTLIPCPAVAFGMYGIRSLIWTFFFYHVVCLLPACIILRQLWLPHVILPTFRQWLLLAGATVLTTTIGLALYIYNGDLIVSRQEVIAVLTERGFQAIYLLPLSIYFVVVNAALEELFWRGVVLNELDYFKKKWRYTGTIWTAVTFAAWHYLVLRLLLRPGFAELAVLGILAMGFFLLWLYRRTQSIVVPIIWHALVFDLALIVILVAVLR